MIKEGNQEKEFGWHIGTSDGRAARDLRVDDSWFLRMQNTVSKHRESNESIHLQLVMITLELEIYSKG
jgi:hypothetical protein